MGSTEQYAALLALLVFSCMQLLGQHHLCQGAPTFVCREDERMALLQFQDGVQDPYGMLSSWVGMDCCSWLGVTCSNRTSRVIQLDLQGSDYIAISGDEINPCLLALRGLEYLDLSHNDFYKAPIPKFIGSFKKLRHLNLSWSALVGSIPPELGNLSSLRYIDLHQNLAEDSNRALQLAEPSTLYLDIEDGSWLSRLSSLHYLDLSNVKVKNFSRALQLVSMLPFLSELYMAFCTGTTLPLHVNFTSLEILDLRWNNFNTTLPSWLFEIRSLKHLDLSWNSFMGHVPGAMANLTSLEFLDLSYNQLLEGASLSTAVSNVATVTKLHLSHMNLKGELRHWLTKRRLGQLSNLVDLDLVGNSFSGVITDAHFRNLTRLEALDLSHNSLEIHIRPGWTPPQQLYELRLDECVVGQDFPAWLRKIENIYVIRMSNAEIADVIPDWFWNFSLNLFHIDLSNNKIQGKLPASLQHLNNLLCLDLSNNPLEGPFPQLPEKLLDLHISNTSLNGGIPSSICKLKDLFDMDLSGQPVIRRDTILF